MEIVTATEKHIPEIIELWKEFVDYHVAINPRLPVRKDAHHEWEKHLREMMKSENCKVLVALDRGHIVGYSISMINKYPDYYNRRTYGFISDMAVASNYRKTGIGEQMLAKICQWFKSRKVDRIELNVFDGNQAGYSFWKKHGFKDDSHWLTIDLK